jgi:tRNA threonylcarbamoyl adenosine modification protein YeaZ
MKILCLSSANSFTSIALIEELKGKRKLLIEKSWTSQNDEADKLLPAIQALLEKKKTTFKDLEKIVVVRGPGSFTGLRIGVTVANTIAYLNKCDLNSITTFEFWHHVTDLPILVFAGKGALYLSMPDEKEGNLIDLPDINSALEEQNVSEYFGDLTLIQKKEITVAKFIDSDFTFGKIMLKVLEGKLQNSKMVAPLYIKAPSITKSKKTICST